MDWPSWMQDDVLQWLTGIAIAVIGIIVSVVLALRSKRSSKGPSIDGENNIQINDSPGATVIKTGTDSEELQRQKTTLENTKKIIRLLAGIQFHHICHS